MDLARGRLACPSLAYCKDEHRRREKRPYGFFARAAGFCFCAALPFPFAPLLPPFAGLLSESSSESESDETSISSIGACLSSLSLSGATLAVSLESTELEDSDDSSSPPCSSRFSSLSSAAELLASLESSSDALIARRRDAPRWAKCARKFWVEQDAQLFRLRPGDVAAACICSAQPQGGVG